MKKPRKVPLRKCIVTNEQLEKQDLMRIVKNKQNEVFVDETGKAHGRGAYLKRDLKVIEKAEKKNIIAKHFRIEVDQSIYQALKDTING